MQTIRRCATLVDLAELIDTGSLSRETLGLICKLAQLKTKGVKSLFKWLTEAFVKRWPMERECWTCLISLGFMLMKGF